MEISIKPGTPPEKVFTERSGSKYDKAINTAIENRGKWIQVGYAPVSKRDSMYSTASAIRGGRLGNIPNGVELEIVCRRVNDRIIMFMKSR
jgi:hypothetical protein